MDNKQNIAPFVKGQYVKFHTNDEWNDLIGIVDEVNYEFEMLFIFCIQFPWTRYHVNFGNAEKILELYK